MYFHKPNKYFKAHFPDDRTFNIYIVECGRMYRKSTWIGGSTQFWDKTVLQRHHSWSSHQSNGGGAMVRTKSRGKERSGVLYTWEYTAGKQNIFIELGFLD